MKYKYLFNSYRPRNKCGSAVATFLGGGLLNGLNSYVSYKSSENIANKQIAAQKLFLITNKN